MTSCGKIWWSFFFVYVILVQKILKLLDPILFIVCIQLNCRAVFLTDSSTLFFLVLFFFIASDVTECDLQSFEMRNIKLIYLYLSASLPLFLSSTELYSWQQSSSVCGRVSHHPSSEYPFTSVFVAVCIMCLHSLKQDA